MIDLTNDTHRRYNILTGEWVLDSPHRTKRPWQGKTEPKAEGQRPDQYKQPCNPLKDGANEIRND